MNRATRVRRFVARAEDRRDVEQARLVVTPNADFHGRARHLSEHAFGELWLGVVRLVAVDERTSDAEVQYQTRLVVEYHGEEGGEQRGPPKERAHAVGRRRRPRTGRGAKRRL